MMNNTSKGFILVSAVVTLTVVSALAAINLTRAQNQLKLDVLQKDGWNAMYACHSAQNVALAYLKNDQELSGEQTLKLYPDDYPKLQKDPNFKIKKNDEVDDGYTITSLCYGTLEHVIIKTELSYDSSTASVTNWKICKNAHDEKLDECK